MDDFDRSDETDGESDRAVRATVFRARHAAHGGCHRGMRQLFNAPCRCFRISEERGGARRDLPADYQDRGQCHDTLERGLGKLYQKAKAGDAMEFIGVTRSQSSERAWTGLMTSPTKSKASSSSMSESGSAHREGRLAHHHRRADRRRADLRFPQRPARRGELDRHRRVHRCFRLRSPSPSPRSSISSPFCFRAARAQTVGTGLIAPDVVDWRVIFGALTGATAWNLITWSAAIPSSAGTR